jgi:TPR repeat protein
MAANQNHSDAQFAYGFCLEHGICVKADLRAAAGRYSKAGRKLDALFALRVLCQSDQRFQPFLPTINAAIAALPAGRQNGKESTFSKVETEKNPKRQQTTLIRPPIHWSRLLELPQFPHRPALE